LGAFQVTSYGRIGVPPEGSEPRYLHLLSGGTQYDHDSYGRVTEVRYYPTYNGGAEDTAQRVDYYYDGTIPFYSTFSTGSSKGRLHWVPSFDRHGGSISAESSRSTVWNRDHGIAL
jgi:hypothetical protein